MTDFSSDSFAFLQAFWPEIYECGRKAEQVAAREPDFAAIQLRIFSERMVLELFGHIGLVHDSAGSHFDRLVALENADLLDRRLLAKFHTIRKVGNNAAHRGNISPETIETLLEDAWSLACWFCRFMRPEETWHTPSRASWHLAAALAAAEDSTVERQPTAADNRANVIRFPEERIKRIREQVSRAMAEVDPTVRQLRTCVTIHEAFTEKLSDDQAACLEALAKFLADPGGRVFMLKGFAGTGKTFLIKGITEYFAAQGRAFRVAAPTGRAAKIISEKTGRDARTVHGEIYDFGKLREYAAENLDQGSETFKFYADIAVNRDQANTVYIVDEASLLSDSYSESDFFRSGTGYLLHDLISYIGFEHSENDRKIIFVGDPAQLPPVGMSTSPALDSAYIRRNFALEASEYELKEVLRQKADSGVIRNVMPIRESLLNGRFSTLSFDFGGDVQRLRSDEVLSRYMDARTGGEKNNPIIVTRSNGEAATFNRAIRENLFPGQPHVTSGDRLIVTANAFIDGSFLANGEFVDVVHAETMVERRSVTLRHRDPTTGVAEDVEVQLVFRDIQLVISSPNDESVLTAKILDDHLHGSGSGLEAVQQRALYVDFLMRHPDIRQGGDKELIGKIIRQDPYFNALRVKFGYAVTCHKAQGGEWSNVFVSCPGGQNPRSADYFRWMYTAMTRASGTLYLIDPPEVRLKVAGANWWSSEGASPGPTQEHVSPSMEGTMSPEERVSPQEAFRAGVLAQVRELLAGTSIVIDDVAHYQYQEAFYLSHDLDNARVNISYNGRFKITAVTVPPSGAFAERLSEHLQPIVGQSFPAAPISPGRNGVPPTVQLPTRQFLARFHDRLVPQLAEREIRVVGLKEQAWSQRYTFERGKESAVVDVFYDGRERLKSCMPVPGERFNRAGGKLLPDVLEVLLSEVNP